MEEKKLRLKFDYGRLKSIYQFTKFFFYNLDLWHFYVLESGLSYFLYLFICLLLVYFVSVADVTALVYFVSVAGCRCIDL